jgi:hypothetical protein
VKLLKGKRLKSVTSTWTQPYLGLVHFLVDGPASMLTVGKGLGECGSFGSVIALGRIQRLILSGTACFGGACAGIMALNDPS